MLFLIITVFSVYLQGEIKWAVGDRKLRKPEYANAINNWALPVFMLLDTIMLAYALIRIRLQLKSRTDK